MNSPTARTVHDPLLNHGPGRDRDHVASYWAVTAGDNPGDDGTLGRDLDVDVAIVGAGYTGLSTAYHLARDHGVKAVVLEANRVGWGCSGRNGGHVRPTIGKLSFERVIEKWGLDTAKRVFAETEAALEMTRHLAEQSPDRADLIEGGVLKVAHKPSRTAALQEEMRLLSETFGWRADFLDAETVRRDYMSGPECHGALLLPDCIGIHPLKLTHGVLGLARNAGAAVHTGTPVEEWRRTGDRSVLTTPAGAVTATTVALATNGYTAERLHPALSGKLMPVLSHIIVTRPLSDEERDACNFKSLLPMTDTRNINQYYRLLPDNRILFGSRGAPNDDPSSYHRQRQFLATRLARKFPPLAGIEIDFDWNGWVSLTADWIPHVRQIETSPSVFCAVGYGGGGIAYSLLAGKRMAACIAGDEAGLPDIPSLTEPYKPFPFAPFRRLGQRAALLYLQTLDNMG